MRRLELVVVVGSCAVGFALRTSGGGQAASADHASSSASRTDGLDEGWKSLLCDRDRDQDRLDLTIPLAILLAVVDFHSGG